MRAGEVVELAARQVTISQLDILQIRRLDKTIQVDIEVTCSAGTFIRAIARDCGTALGTGGHLNSLRRSRVAGFALDRAVSLAQLKNGEFSTLALADVARATFSLLRTPPPLVYERRGNFCKSFLEIISYAISTKSKGQF